MSLTSRLAGAGALLLVSFACGCTKDGAADLEPLPAPAISRLEPAVAERLSRASDGVRGVLERADADRGESARAMGELGQLYHAYDLFEAAAVCYRNAERLAPGEAKWSYLLARALHSSHRYDEAREAYARALEAAPADPAVRLALARLHREQRAFAEARRLADAVLEAHPDSAAALLLRAELATDQNDPRRAVEDYERLLELQPGARRLHQPLAMAWRALGDLDEARKHLALAGDGGVSIEDPMLVEVRTLVASTQRALSDEGVAAYRAGDFARAAEAFGRAVAADPSSVGARVNLGSALARLERFDEALEQFRQVLVLEPEHVLARFNLGVISGKQGRLAEAIGYYEEALAIDATHRDARYNLANALRASARIDDALAHYRRILDEEPGHAPARVGEWLCLLELGEPDRLRQRIDEGLAALPEHAGLLDAAARMLAACPVAGVRDGSRALALAERLIGATRTPRHLETLAMALAELGRYPEAVATQREALAAAEAAAQSARLEPLRANLERYERGQPCRDPAL